jgi:hypothetical protein
MKRETVLPGALDLSSAHRSPGGKPAGRACGLARSGRLFDGRWGLSSANREWFQLLEPATREGAGWLACLDVDAPRRCCVMPCHGGRSV